MCDDSGAVPLSVRAKALQDRIFSNPQPPTERCFWTEQRTENWFEFRRHVRSFEGVGVHPITGSNLSTVLGFWEKTRMKEYYDWVRGGEPMGLPESSMEACNHGTEWEPVATQKYKAAAQKSFSWGRTVEVYEVGAYDVYPWLLVSADGLVSLETDWCALEIKCPFMRGKKRAHSSIPPYYMPQIQAEMEALNTSSCHFVSYGTSDSKIRIWEVRRERALWAKIYEASLSFWCAQTFGEACSEELEALRGGIVAQCKAVSYYQCRKLFDGVL